jgi:hypothetical protein
VAILAISACGGSSEAKPPASTGTTTQAPAPTKAHSASDQRFIAAAEAICRRLDGEVLSGASGSEAQQIEQLGPTNLAHEQRALRELGRLQPPPALATGWASVKRRRAELADALAKLIHAAKTNNQNNMKILVLAKHQMHEELRTAGKQSGFTYCADVT